MEFVSPENSNRGVGCSDDAMLGVAARGSDTACHADSLEHFADATISGRDDDPALDRMLAFSVGRNEREWDFRRVDLTARDLFRRLAQHDARPNKDGLFFFAGALTTGRRQADRVQSVELIVIDCDDVSTVADGLAVQSHLDLTSVLYTSHSHRDEHHKFRLAILLAEPYRVDVTASLQDRKDHFRATYQHVVGLTGLHYDVAGERLNQGYYAPSHRLSSPFRAHVHIGRALALPSVTLPPARERRATAAASRKEGAPVADIALRREFGRFIRDHGSRFAIAEYVEALGWGVRWQGADKAVLRCPNEAQHSEITEDDEACVAMNPTTGRGAITCLHGHCQEIGTADFLTMIASALEIEGDPIELAYEFLGATP